MALALSIALLSFTACGTPSQNTNETEAARSTERASVTIEGIAYAPATLTVDGGTEVTWTNDDPVHHTVTSGKQQTQGVPGVGKDKPAQPDGVIDGDLDGRGTTFSFTFDEPGSYEYFCQIHSGMSAVIVIK